MKSKTEENKLLYKVLKEVGRGYETGDFSGFYPYLREDCVLTSHWVLTDLTGYDNIVYYFDGKGETLRRHDCLAHTTVVELVGNTHLLPSNEIGINGATPQSGRVEIYYKSGKYCLLMEQTINGEVIRILVDVKLDDEGMVKQINLCEPAMFQFREV